MRLFVDTAVLMWLFQDNPRLGSNARNQVGTAANIFVSAASVWEANHLRAIGAYEFHGDLLDMIERSGFEDLPISSKHSTQIHSIILPNNDAYDRILLAQAKTEQLALLTADDTLLSSHPDICIDARI